MRLDSAEARNAEHPDKFEIPSRFIRESLRPGCFAKLLFQVDDPEAQYKEHRMWVLVRERLDDGSYLGDLDGPSEFHDLLKTESPIAFGPHHVADVMPPKDWRESTDS